MEPPSDLQLNYPDQQPAGSRSAWRTLRRPNHFSPLISLISLIMPLLRIFMLVILLLPALSVFGAGCAEEPVLGPINDQAPVVLMRYESQDDGLDGVVYRQVNHLDSLLATSKVPVLVVFYSSLAPINSLIIPRLEQMTDDYRDRLQIVWINANAEPALADSFNVEKLPQFTVVVEASLKRSLIGYDDQGAVRLEELLEPYLDGQ